MIAKYEEKKQQLLTQQDNCCSSCGEMFNGFTKIDLSHNLIRSRANIKLFGLLVIDHVSNLDATHANGHKGLFCNDNVIINRSTNPIKAYEKVIDIISHIIIENPPEVDYNELRRAFDNIKRYKLDDINSLSKYDMLEQLFEPFRIYDK